VHEDVFATLLLDEAVALLSVEPFYFALSQLILLVSGACPQTRTLNYCCLRKVPIANTQPTIPAYSVACLIWCRKGRRRKGPQAPARDYERGMTKLSARLSAFSPAGARPYLACGPAT
jgi:hypothetical protein